MKILLYTKDMYPGTERLMPWRTLIEVAKYMNTLPDTYAEVCSGQSEAEETCRKYDSVPVKVLAAGIAPLAAYIREAGFDAVYYPIAFRDIHKPLGLLRDTDAVKIAYIPGGIYSAAGLPAAFRAGGLQLLKPYLLEKLIPHGMVLGMLKKAGFSSVVTLSQTTADDVVKHGWPKNRVHMSLPGMDGFADLEPDYGRWQKEPLEHTEFLLFTGAPAPIRGGSLLLKAFDEFAAKNDSVRLVMLMRRDNGSDFRCFERTLRSIRHSNRVSVIYDKLRPAELKAFFLKAHAVVLPFLLVPSEIPLTFFEVLSCGTPVVTFDNGGTTQYIRPAAVWSHSRSKKALARSLAKICGDAGFRDELSRQAAVLTEKHPSWTETAKIWIKPLQDPAASSSAESTVRERRR